MDNYKRNLKEASDRYLAEKAVYDAAVKTQKNRAEVADNQNSIGSMIKAGQKSKIVLVEPVLSAIPEPTLKAPYEQTLPRYIGLIGRKRDPTDALQLTIDIGTYVHSRPRLQTENHVELDARAQEYTSYRFYDEMYYSLPIKVTVRSPDGKIIFSVQPNTFLLKKLYKSEPVDESIDVNHHLVIAEAEHQVLKNNLKYINKLLNYGLEVSEHTAALYKVSIKDIRPRPGQPWFFCDLS